MYDRHSSQPSSSFLSATSGFQQIESYDGTRYDIHPPRAPHSDLPQPYVALAQGGTRAEDSLLVDYVMSKYVYSYPSALNIFSDVL